MSKQRVNGGEYYWRMGPHGPLEPASPDVPDVVICRRVDDYPDEQIPRGGVVKYCRDCGAAIATNIEAFPDRPRICMQCANIQPLPIEDAH